MKLDDDCRHLMALLAHEMRSPGAVVAGYLRMLKTSGAELPAREQKMIEEANRSCGRLMHIVQELGELGELASQELSRAPVAIFSLCDDVVQSASHEGADVSFVCDDADREAMIDGHEARLKQAVSSLIASLVRERGSASIRVTHGDAGGAHRVRRSWRGRVRSRSAQASAGAVRSLARRHGLVAADRALHRAGTPRRAVGATGIASDMCGVAASHMRHRRRRNGGRVSGLFARRAPRSVHATPEVGEFCFSASSPESRTGRMC